MQLHLWSLNTQQTYEFTAAAVGQRALKNRCLFYLIKDGELELAKSQFDKADCMSDKFCATTQTIGCIKRE
jgi:aminopeptidase N